MSDVQARIDQLRRSADSVTQSAYRANTAGQRNEEFLIAKQLRDEADHLEKGLSNGGSN